MAEEEKRLLTGTCKEEEGEGGGKNDATKKREAEKKEREEKKDRMSFTYASIHSFIHSKWILEFYISSSFILSFFSFSRREREREREREGNVTIDSFKTKFFSFSAYATSTKKPTTTTTTLTIASNDALYPFSLSFHSFNSVLSAERLLSLFCSLALMVFSTVNYNDYSTRIIISPFYTRARSRTHTHIRERTHTRFSSLISLMRAESCMYIFVVLVPFSPVSLFFSFIVVVFPETKHIIRSFFRFFSLCLASIRIRLIHHRQVLRHHRSRLHVFSSLI